MEKKDKQFNSFFNTNLGEVNLLTLTKEVESLKKRVKMLENKVNKQKTGVNNEQG